MTGAVVWVSGTARLGVFRGIDDDIIYTDVSTAILNFDPAFFWQDFWQEEGCSLVADAVAAVRPCCC